MKKTLSVLILILALAFGGCAAGTPPNSDINSTPSSENTNAGQTSNDISQENSLQTPSPAQQQKYMDLYILKAFGMTFQSWNDPHEIEAFRFGGFYGRNALDISKYEPEQFYSPGLGYAIPQDIYEEFIQMYFDVSSEHLRQSKFYDPENKIYTGFLASGGAPGVYEMLGINQLDNNREEIIYISSPVDPTTGSEVTIRLVIEHGENEGQFKYVAVEILE